MHKESSLEERTDLKSQNEENISIFSKEILRDILLPDLLGREHSQILYWAGKQLARKFPLADRQEIQEFFMNAGWGELVEQKTSKHEAEYILQGTIIERRLDLNKDCEFQIEAGFLAQQLEIIQKRITEAVPETKQKSKQVHILVRWDVKDIVEY
ncbi:MAG: YslB family protein [Bacillus sp. (in: firmicutes)]